MTFIYFLLSLFLLAIPSLFERTSSNKFLIFRIATLTTTIIASRYLLSVVLSDAGSVFTIGNIYTKQLTAWDQTSQSTLHLLYIYISVLTRHILTLSFSFFVPLFFMIRHTYFTPKSQSKSMPSIEDKMIKFFLVLLVTHIFCVSIFTVLVSKFGPLESLDRLHQRYYLPIIALLPFVSFLTFSSQRSLLLSKRTSITLILINGVSSIFLGYLIDRGAIEGFSDLRLILSPIDNVLLWGMAEWPLERALYLAASTVSLLLFTHRSTLQSAIYLLLLTYILLYLTIQIRIFHLNMTRTAPNSSEIGALMSKHVLPTTFLKYITVISDKDYLAMSSLFVLNRPDATFEVVPAHAQITRPKDNTDRHKPRIYLTTSGQRWDNGNYLFASSTINLIHDPSYYLLDLSKPGWDVFVANHTGLSPTESFGATFTDGNIVTLTLRQPLNGYVTIKIAADAFASNVGLPINVIVDQSLAQMRFNDIVTEQAVSLAVTRPSSTISIVIPAAVSPKSLGINQDERLLGIAIRSITIHTSAPN